MTTKPETDLLKCRYCDWTTRKWQRRKSDGKATSGWRRLQDHLEYKHGVITDLIGEQNATEEGEVTQSIPTECED